MRRVPLILGLVLTLVSAQALSSPKKGRGTLTAVGAVALALGIGFGGASLGAHLSAEEGRALYSPYHGNTTSEEVEVARELNGGRKELNGGQGEIWIPGLIWTATTMRNVFAIAGATLVTGGIVLLVLDSFLAASPVQAAIVPTQSGLLAQLGLRF